MKPCREVAHMTTTSTSAYSEHTDTLVHPTAQNNHRTPRWAPRSTSQTSNSRRKSNAAPGIRQNRINRLYLQPYRPLLITAQPEVQACSYGIWADFQGPDMVPGGVLTWEEYNAIMVRNTRHGLMFLLQEYPRLRLMKGLKDNMLHLCKTKPGTTYDNTVGEWGDRYLSEDEYNRKPNLTQNLLETLYRVHQVTDMEVNSIAMSILDHFIAIGISPSR
ncbi:uncharacterized protein MYCFIDRAFT_208140 [Pseudocercospora fijiensis CIRAD86]|uniref:Uncharacterized protein n=1 Tax=Pseudocercospora fijiensis (strain CIRAD86) TaxID=383855 RepID=M3AZ85_PSEFD|nr:uncharacterized protein MYCFIDRAFT_208140 [Pseudocercospora fijiensis CIRAD86]EME82522.1 hypothetical protein MYCFIDRAFT_208140 [Pseudocercospora fijiensis CIRAD86]